jgi:hypothetical protein
MRRILWNAESSELDLGARVGLGGTPFIAGGLEQLAGASVVLGPTLLAPKNEHAEVLTGVGDAALASHLIEGSGLDLVRRTTAALVVHFS